MPSRCSMANTVVALSVAPLSPCSTGRTGSACTPQVGDILATGTISGPADSSAGCLLELTRNGAHTITLPTGEVRSFLADGDEIILRGSCEAAGHRRLGLGECRARILPAHT